MGDSGRSRAFLRDTTLSLAAVLAVCVAGAEVLIDFMTWIQLNVSILYALPLVLAAQARSRRLIWALAGILVTATFIVYWLQVPPGEFSLHEEFVLNRVLSSAAMLVTAVLLHVWMNAVDVVDAQDRLLRQQNEELQRLREEAEESSARKTQLLTSMSHDLRTPVNAIRLMAEVIQRTADDPTLVADIAHLSHRLQHDAQSLADFLTNMLEMSAFDSGRLVLHESEFSLNELLAEECSRLLPLAHAKRLRLTWQGPEPPARLETDRAKLMRVLSNLVGNAIKFTETGEVAVDAVITAERAVEIRVRDTGIGIAPDVVRELFTPFNQGPQGLERSRGGLGLGLATVKGLVELHGGTIAVHSEGIGRGSEFAVTFPAIRPPSARPAAAPPTPPRHLRVLVIEDNTDAGETLKDLLELSGHEVRVAGDGPTGVGLAHAFHPDLVLCDLGLPQMNGFEVARALRADQTLHAWLVALSGYAQHEDIRRAGEVGFDRHVSKPASPEVLNALLVEAAAHAPETRPS